MRKISLLKKFIGKEVAVHDNQTGENLASGIAEVRSGVYFVNGMRIPKSSIRNVTQTPSQRFYQGLIFVDHNYNLGRKIA